MECPNDTSAFTDRTGTTSAMTSQAAALQLTETTSADDAVAIGAMTAMEAATREELLAMVEAEANLEPLATETTLAPGGGEVPAAPVGPEEDEGPTDALDQPTDDSGDDVGIPQEILDAVANPAAATGGEPAKKTDDPKPGGEKLVEEGKDPVADVKADEGKVENAGTEAAENGEETPEISDPDPLPEDEIDLSGLTPEEILAAMAEAAGEGPGTEAEAGNGGETVDMGAGMAMTPDMCPMEAAEMMIVGETETGMADMAADMMSEMEMAAEMDTMSMEMADEDM